MSPLREITTNKIIVVGKVMCEYCRLVFEKESDLQEHVKEHDGEVNNCRLCESSFSSKWNLRRHIDRLHSEGQDEESKENKSEITVFCDICNQGFRGR